MWGHLRRRASDTRSTEETPSWTSSLKESTPSHSALQRCSNRTGWSRQFHDTVATRRTRHHHVARSSFLRPQSPATVADVRGRHHRDALRQRGDWARRAPRVSRDSSLAGATSIRDASTARGRPRAYLDTPQRPVITRQRDQHRSHRARSGPTSRHSLTGAQPWNEGSADFSTLPSVGCTAGAAWACGQR